MDQKYEYYCGECNTGFLGSVAACLSCGAIDIRPVESTTNYSTMEQSFNFCPKCGTKSGEGDLYCRNCGYAEEPQESPEPMAPSVELGNEPFYVNPEVAASLGFTDDDGNPLLVTATEDEEGLTMTPHPEVVFTHEEREGPDANLVWVSYDGETVQAPDGSDMTEDEIAVSILRGRYQVEDAPGAFEVYAPAIDDDALVNRIRQRAIRDHEALPGIPEPLHKLIWTEQLAPDLCAAMVLTPFRKEMGRKLWKLDLTDSGKAMLNALSYWGYIFWNRKKFIKAFDGDAEMLPVNAARFASGLFPNLKSCTNDFHETLAETEFMLDQLPEVRKLPKELIGTELDQPMYSPIDLICGITEGMMALFWGEGSEARNGRASRRLKHFIEEGFDQSQVKPKHHLSLIHLMGHQFMFVGMAIHEVPKVLGLAYDAAEDAVEWNKNNP